MNWGGGRARGRHLPSRRGGHVLAESPVPPPPSPSAGHVSGGGAAAAQGLPGSESARLREEPWPGRTGGGREGGREGGPEPGEGAEGLAQGRRRRPSPTSPRRQPGPVPRWSGGTPGEPLSPPARELPRASFLPLTPPPSRPAGGRACSCAPRAVGGSAAATPPLPRASSCPPRPAGRWRQPGNGPGLAERRTEVRRGRGWGLRAGAGEGGGGCPPGPARSPAPVPTGGEGAGSW